MKILLFLMCTFLLFSCREKELSNTVNAQAPKVGVNQRRMPAGEFRAAWVATVRNMDWPSRPGLSAAVQKQEAINLLDRAVAMKLNAVIFQVRPHCDAFYRSVHEPWSCYLSGVQGRDPGYDPLQFWITEAHRRGLELHAWFNPFRMRHPSMKGGYSEKSIAKRRQHWGYELKKGYAWLDPGRKEVQDFSSDVIMDVVKRYDIDGVHLDDYFYPYPEFTQNGFPDSKTYGLYRRNGGSLGLSDWRRENINNFVRDLYTKIKRSGKPIRFGISPFGIWRPGFPKGIKGLDAYEVIYADSRKWLQEGWVDYLAPQLYWSTEDKEQDFTRLLDWWRSQNVKKKDIYPGLAIYKVEKYPGGFREIIKQMQIIKQRADVRGYIHFNLKPLLEKDYIAKPIADSERSVALVPPLQAKGFDAVPVNVDISNEVLTWGCRSNQVRRWLIFVGETPMIFPRTVNTVKLKMPGRVSIIPIGPAGIPGRMISINR